MNTIYHYTDLNAFYNIIKNKNLWLSSANNLNDHQEVKWFINKVYNKLDNLVDTNNVHFLNEFWLQSDANSPMPYICSFSRDGDSLSQWRAYANDGEGISIGFNLDYFNSKFHSELITMNAMEDRSIGIKNVIYSHEEQEKKINEIVSLLIPPYVDDKDKFDRHMRALLLINNYSYICKNNVFFEENEVRIIHTPLITGNKEGKTSLIGNISELQYRVTDSTLTSYFELDFSDANKESAICEIIIGPKCKISTYDIELFLSINGLGKIPYRFSKASYR